MRTNIPSQVQQAMNQQLQATLPAHLKQYLGDSHGFVPPQAQREIASYMQRMPQHLRRYSDAYMQQRVTQASFGSPRSAPSMDRPPMPDHNRLGHSMPVGEQFNAPWAETAARQTETPHQPVTGSPGAAPHPAGLSNDYAFIMNPDQPPRRSRLPGGNSMMGRVLLVLGGLLMLLVLFALIRGLLSSSNLNDFVGLAQEQQAMIHLTEKATEQPGLSETNRNFAITAQLSLANSQNETIGYLNKNGKKVNGRQLALKISAATDKRLEDAGSTGSYDTVFHDIMKQKLDNYGSTLQQAYGRTKGPKGRQLLSNEYDRTKLLMQQLGENQ